MMGLAEFPEEASVFGALFEQYRDKLEATYEKTRSFVEGLEKSLPSKTEYPETWYSP